MSKEDPRPMVFALAFEDLGLPSSLDVYILPITLVNVADAPARDCPLPEACDSVLPVGCGFDSLLDFCSLTSLNRVGANWVRLALLVAKLDLGWKSLSESWRYSHIKFGRWRFVTGKSRPALDFDQTLGFPGEGPFDRTSRKLCLSLAILALPCLVAFGLHCVCVVPGVGFSRGLWIPTLACFAQILSVSLLDSFCFFAC